MNQYTVGVAVACGLMALSARGVEPKSKCTIDVQTATPGEEQRASHVYEQIKKAGFAIEHTGRARLSHEALEVFFSADCAKEARRLGKALGVDATRIRAANWQMRDGLTVALRGPGWGEKASGRGCDIIGQSQYGAFEVSFNDAESICSLSFRHAASGAKLLAQISDCMSADGCHVRSSRSINRVSEGFPKRASSGEEFHLFEIATARGGNACGGSDHYAVVVGPDRVWATPSFGGCSIVERADLDDAKSALTLEVPATTTREGHRYRVSMGELTDTTLPPRPREVLSKREFTLEGAVNSGGHATDWRPQIGGVTIHEDGQCKLEKLGGESVTMDVIEQVYDDGNTVVTCLRVK